MSLFLRQTLTAAALCAAMSAQAAIHLETPKNGIIIRDCVVQAPIAGQTQTVAFATIESTRDDTVELTKVSASQLTDNISLHEMKHENGVTEMMPVKSIAIPKGVTKLEKGGYHLMLEDLDSAPQKGTERFLLLAFDFVTPEDHATLSSQCRAQIVSAKDLVMEEVTEDHSDHSDQSTSSEPAPEK